MVSWVALENNVGKMCYALRPARRLQLLSLFLPKVTIVIGWKEDRKETGLPPDPLKPLNVILYIKNF